MARVGGLMALMGVVSSLLTFTEYELRLLLWIGAWGDSVAWFVRLALVVVGLAMMVGEDRLTAESGPA